MIIKMLCLFSFFFNTVALVYTLRSGTDWDTEDSDDNGHSNDDRDAVADDHDDDHIITLLSVPKVIT